jgi:IclR family KDG regulon transcriptional repressor
LGKAILSGMALGDVAGIVNEYGLKASTAKTITDRDRFLEEILRTRTQGFALDDEENERGVRCVAAPILDHRDLPTVAVSISAPVLRIPMSKVPLYGQRVRETAEVISRTLGYGRLRREE